MMNESYLIEHIPFFKSHISIEYAFVKLRTSNLKTYKEQLRNRNLKNPDAPSTYSHKSINTVNNLRTEV
jgi:hypothetical protein